ncbi:hypothetical protein [Rhodococcus sp. Leaf278]|uniref:hypothetical protein n=1 Tax=Rhodococcus sp. Leaf278 TaxID=1736319 RepID=UPI0012E342FA|nr:hypothetical protein [Rhodococcus sp. Leaf278]
MPERDPFMPAYAPFSGARTPDLWKFLWLPPSDTAVTSYGHSDLAPAQDLSTEPLLALHLDTVIRMSGRALTSPAGPSLQYRTPQMCVMGVFMPATNTVVELAPDIGEVMFTGCRVAGVVAKWAEIDHHSMPGSVHAVLRTMAAAEMVDIVDDGRAASDLQSIPAEPTDLLMWQSGAVFEYVEPDSDELRLFCFATGDRLRLSAGAAAIWRSVDGSTVATIDVRNDAFLQRLLAGGFIHMERGDVG